MNVQKWYFWMKYGVAGVFSLVLVIALGISFLKLFSQHPLDVLSAHDADVILEFPTSESTVAQWAKLDSKLNLSELTARWFSKTDGLTLITSMMNSIKGSVYVVKYHDEFVVLFEPKEEQKEQIKSVLGSLYSVRSEGPYVLVATSDEIIVKHLFTAKEAPLSTRVRSERRFDDALVNVVLTEDGKVGDMVSSLMTPEAFSSVTMLVNVLSSPIHAGAGFLVLEEDGSAHIIGDALLDRDLFLPLKAPSALDKNMLRFVHGSGSGALILLPAQAMDHVLALYEAEGKGVMALVKALVQEVAVSQFMVTSPDAVFNQDHTIVVGTEKREDATRWYYQGIDEEQLKKEQFHHVVLTQTKTTEEITLPDNTTGTILSVDPDQVKEIEVGSGALMQQLEVEGSITHSLFEFDDLLVLSDQEDVMPEDNTPIQQWVDRLLPAKQMLFWGPFPSIVTFGHTSEGQPMLDAGAFDHVVVGLQSFDDRIQFELIITPSEIHEAP